MTKSLAYVGWLLGWTCSFALQPRAASASPLFELVGDTQGAGGLQAGAVPDNASATYFNPALLSDTPAGVNVGAVFLLQSIGTSVDPRPGTQYDVPAGVSSATHADYSRFDDYPIPTGELQIGRAGDTQNQPLKARPRQGAGTGQQTNVYLAFGLVVKAWRDRVALGLNGLLPVPKFTTLAAFYSDEREQFYSNSLHPELYGDRLSAPSIAFGGAIKVSDHLSLGIGASLNISAPATARTHVSDINNLDKLTLDVKAPVTVGLAPYFGGSYTLLHKRLRLTATAHAPSKVDVGAGFTFLIGDGQEDGSKQHFVLDYMPWRAGFGAAFDFVQQPGRTLSLVATLTYTRWSQYVDRHHERPTPGYAWSDILAPTLGVRHKAGAYSSLLDLSYSPTPVAPQTGRTSYVDNDRISAAVGGDLAFEAFGVRARCGLQVQAHYLIKRHQNKIVTPTDASGRNVAPQLVKDEVPDDAVAGGQPLAGSSGLQTNNPGFPGFGSQGIILVGSLYVRAAF